MTRWTLTTALAGFLAASACATREAAIEAPAVKAEPPPAALYIMGDSTAANYPAARYPQIGWGMVLQCGLDDKVTVHNRAIGGRSTRTFREEGRWDSILAELKAGDTVLIQFGHNDASVNRPQRYVEARGGFKSNLELFVAGIRGKGAVPVLLTPMVMHRFKDGVMPDMHGEYDDVVREVAAATGAQLIDLEADSRALVMREGEEASRRFFMYLEPGAYPSHPEGLKDGVHFNEPGARTMARLIASRLAALDTPVSARIDPTAPGLSSSLVKGEPGCGPLPSGPMPAPAAAPAAPASAAPVEPPSNFAN